MSDFNLGTVTAYGYAKDKGYTGTENEYAELMASYADVAEQAAESAEQAAASATTAAASASNAAQSATAAASSKTAAETAQGGAETAAQTATTKASEASASATTASGKATEATTAATTATSKASEATTAATTATTKAGEASTSATNAAASATRAQEILDSIPEDYSQLSEDVSDLKDGLTAVESDVTDLKEDYTTILDSAYVTDTASGAIASFPDGADNVPVKSLTVDIEPVQDLHGQANPYPAGGGKNLFEITATTQTINGVTFTVNSDGTVSLSGTATSNAVLVLGTVALNGGTAYILNGCPQGGSTSKYLLSFPGIGYDSGSGYNHTPSADITPNVAITIYSGQNVGGLVFKPMVRLASVSDATFAPYENICPISGHTSAVVTRTGKNLFDFKSDYSDWSDGYLRGDNGLPSGTAAVAPAYERTTPFIPIKGGLPFTFSFTNISSATISNNMCFYDADKNFIGTRIVDGAHFYITGTAPDNAAYVRVSARTFNGMSNVQLEVGSTATAYEPYNGQTVTIDLDGTIYGGTLDVGTGVLTVDRTIRKVGDCTWSSTNTSAGHWRFYSAQSDIAVDLESLISDTYKIITPSAQYQGTQGISEQVSGNNVLVMISDETYSTASDFKTARADSDFVVKLAEPLTIQLTANELKTVLGQNNIWSDAGDVEVEYRADTKLYINKVLNA